MTFTVSTIFHMAQDPVVRRTFKILDHISIFFFISGSYTPFLLVYMSNAFGTSLLITLWSLTVAGTVFKIFSTGKYEVVSTFIYLAMGWIMVAGGRKFFDQIPASVLIFIIAGAVLYSIGAFFYLWDKYPYTHAVWHAFVLAAALCHYTAVLLAM
jgi:hemolysin III